ncbi:MAG: ABC transporter permease [Algicola sp.]|nr:ABC transporter permease [Algicola sp.]
MKFWFDFKYAMRLLMKKPSFTALTVGVMACGLGLCVYMFTFINNTMFKPLDFENGERMVVMDREVNGVVSNGGQVKFDYYQDIKAQSTSFDMFGAMQNYTMTISGGDTAVSYDTVAAEPMMFDFTKVQPLQGRVFNETDDMPGAAGVAVIGYDMWQNYFAGSKEILGHEFYIEGDKTQVIGVMPQGYLFPRSAQLWIPIKLEHTKYARGGGPRVSAYGMLKEGVTREQANVEMKQILNRINTQFPEFNTGEGIVASTYMVSMMGHSVIPIMIIMLVAVAFVLFLACSNVGNLLYARSNERAKETAIRVALGAPQSRLVMQMLWESLIICTLGGVFALLMAAYGIEVTNKIMPTFLSGRAPFWWNIQLDSSLVWFTFGLTLVTTLVTGIMPARKIVNGDFNAVLRDGTRGAQSRTAKRVSQGLVIFEVALSIALLTAAIVMAVAVKMAINTDYGAKTTNMLTARISLPLKTYDTDAKRIQYFETLQTELEQITGVTGVAVASRTPAQNASYRAVLLEGMELGKDARPPRANTINMMPGAFETFEFDLIQGRYFSAADNASSENVIVVSQSFVDKHWPGDQNVLGKRVKWADVENGKWYRVIGVVGTVIHGQPFSDFKYRPSIYRSNLQVGSSYMSIAVKTSGDANKLRKALLKAVDSVDGNVPAFRVKTIEAVVSRNTAGIEFVIQLFLIFGACATILAGSGIYALMSNAITNRTQELGVRRALGSTDSQVVKMLMKQGIWQLGIGTVLGLPVAFLFGNLIMGIIGVNSTAIYSVFVIIPGFIAAVVMLATYIPASRVTRLEPNVALRYE